MEFVDKKSVKSHPSFNKITERTINLNIKYFSRTVQGLIKRLGIQTETCRKKAVSIYSAIEGCVPQWILQRWPRRKLKEKMKKKKRTGSGELFQESRIKVKKFPISSTARGEGPL